MELDAVSHGGRNLEARVAGAGLVRTRGGTKEEQMAFFSVCLAREHSRKNDVSLSSVLDGDEVALRPWMRCGGLFSAN